MLTSDEIIFPFIYIYFLLEWPIRSFSYHSGTSPPPQMEEAERREGKVDRDEARGFFDGAVLHGKEDEERHHQTEETHSLGQSKTQDSVGEQLLLQGGVPKEETR